MMTKLLQRITPLALLLCAALAQATTVSLPADWGYDTPVPPLPRAAWLDKVAVVCMPYETPYETSGTQVTLKPWAKKLQDAGLTIAAMYPDGLCRLYEETPSEPWAEACRLEVARCHKLGIKVIAGAYPFVGSRGPRDIIAAHPEWRIQWEGVQPDSVGIGCMVNPEYARALRELLTRRIKEFDIDAYQFDGWYHQTFCRCEGCRNLYQAETGREIPPKRDMNDVEYRRYNAWRDRKLLENLIALRESVKAVKPDFALINWNNNDTTGSAPSWMPEALNCVADWTNKETWWANDVSSIWLNKRLRGASGDERAPGMQPYTFMRWMKDIEAGVFHGSSTPAPELMYRLREILTFGGVPITWSGARAGWTPEDWDTVVQDFVDYLPLLPESKSLKYAVCIDSYSTLQNARAASTNRAFHEGEGNELDAAVGNYRAGMTRALVEAHIPFDVISEHNVTSQSLAQYKVVILPNNFAMSERIGALLRDYVRRGGGLVASFETSLYDQWGARRKDFLLADLFGASYLDSGKPVACRIGFTTATHPVAQDAKMRGLMGERGMTTYWGRYARVTPRAGAVAPFFGLDPSTSATAPRAWIPALFSEINGGRVAYFPAALEAAYFDAGYPYQRMMLAGAVRWAAQGNAPVTIDAPLAVFAGFFTREQEGHRQTIVHLLNTLNSTTGHGSKEEKQFAMREEVVPVSGVKVAVKGERPRRAYLIPGRAKLPLSNAGDGQWGVTVERLDQHAAVVFEY